MKTLIICTLILYTICPTQTIRENLFSEVDQLKKDLSEINTFRLSQINAEKALKFYQEADNLYSTNGNMNDVRKSIKGSKAYYKNAINVAKLAEKELAYMIKARQDARKMDAEKYEPKNWNKAIERFEEAALELENGDKEDAFEVAGDAEQLFRQMELNALRAIYFDSTKKLIDKANDNDVEDQATKTLQKAKDLLNKADSELKKNRYDTDLPRSLAQQANYEARHALYLDQTIRRFRDKNTTEEDILLLYEIPLTQIASSLDLVAEFDKGHEIVADSVVVRIKFLEKEKEDLLALTSDQTNQIKLLEARVQEMEKKLGGIALEKSALQKQMERQAEIRKWFKTIGTMFPRDKAIVLRDGNDVIIRLISLNFASGKSDIKTGHYALLKEVKKAVSIFEKSTLTITGHTDSYGSDKTNLKLSKARALAIKEYLLSNMNISADNLEAVGYGENKPIANNETAEGRKKNRRIDIVISPIIVDNNE